MVHWNNDPKATWPLDFERLQRTTDRFVETLIGSAQRAEAPPLHVKHDEENVTVVAEVPGFTSAEIEVECVGTTMRLRGTKAAAPEGAQTEDLGFTVRNFERTLRMPYPIDPERVSARLQHGLLKVRAPRLAASMWRRVDINDVE